MSTSINSFLPLTQPFNTSPWNYTGTESVSTIPNNAVDWILVELRTNLNVQGQINRAAFLLNNGKIVDTNGLNPLSFIAIPNDYYIVIKHRNHIPIISSTKINLN